MSIDATNQMVIEQAKSDDLNQTINLWHRAGLTRPWNDPATDFHRALENPTSEIFIIRREGDIIASVMVGDEGHRGWVYYLATDETSRGVGCARALMQKCETWLKARDCPKLMLMVRSSNQPVISYYQNIGYTRSDVVTMEKWLRADTGK